MPKGVYPRRASHNLAISRAMLGRKHTALARECVLAARQRVSKRNFSPRAIENMSKARIGRPLSREHIAAISQGLLKYRSRLERLCQSILESLGIFFRRQYQLPGNRHPFDFAIVDQKILIEADGCYWHGCDCRSGQRSLHRAEYRARDQQLDDYARSLGWTVLRFRECEQVIDWSEL